MLPTISVFGLTIPMYGPLILIGCALGILIAVYLPVRRDIKKQDIFFCALYALIGVIVGAKLLYLAISLPSFIEAHAQTGWTLDDINVLFTHGFVFYGGLIGAILGVLIYSKQYRLPFWHLTDSLIPSVPLMHAIGRIGCFCAGCCYGRAMDPPFGVYFRADSVAPIGVALFPVQLLESVLNFILFIILFGYSRKPRADRQITGLYIACYGVIRFILEFFRGDGERGILWIFSTSQWISLALIPLGLYWLLKATKKRGTEAAL
jgi:phosphatidylglycerol:prolipoprotein diacylglycerol transferase